MRQAFWPPSLQMCARCTQNVCLAHQKRKCIQRFQGLPAVCGPHWLWQIQSKRSLATKFLVDFRRVLEKNRLQIGRFASAAVRLPGSGRLRRSALAFLGCLGGGAAGRSAAAPAAEKTCLDRFGRLRVGKSSTRMANRCPRIFDAGGKGRHRVGCWRSLHH